MAFAVILFSVMIVLYATYVVNPVEADSTGLCFKKNVSKNDVLLVFPEKVQIDNEGNLNVEKWSLDSGEEVRCACISQTDADGGSENLSLCEYSKDCPCKCPFEVKPSHEIQISSHEIQNSGHAKYYSLAMGFKKTSFLTGMNVYVFEEDNSFYVLSRHSKLLPEKSLEVDLKLYQPLPPKYFENFENLASFSNKMDEQKTIFETIIQKPEGNHEDQESYLTLQQLVREEHMMEEWKPLTRYNFNLIAVWNKIAVYRNYILNKILTRHQEGSTNYQLDIISGTSGEYEYQNKAIIPNYLWNLYTVVNSKGEKKSIFLIIHNDPSPELPECSERRKKCSERKKKICERSVCEEYDSFKGIIDKWETVAYCCTVDQNTTKTLFNNSTSQDLIMQTFLSKNTVKQRIEALKERNKQSNNRRSDRRH